MKSTLLGIIGTIATSIMFMSCYKYVEIDSTDFPPSTIKTSSFLCLSDSSAYAKAYEKFCISQAARQMANCRMQEVAPDLYKYLDDDSNLDFILYKFSKDITDATFLHDKSKLERKIEKKFEMLIDQMNKDLQTE